MATIASGENSIVTINAGEVYRVAASDSSQIDVLFGVNWQTVKETVNLSGGNKTYDFGPYSDTTKINIRSLIGSIEYDTITYPAIIAKYATDSTGDITGLEGKIKSSEYEISLSNYDTLDDAISAASINQYQSGVIPKINLGVTNLEFTISANSLKTCEIVGTTFNTTYSAVTSATGSSGNWTVTITVASTLNITVDDYIGLTPSGAGVNPYTLAGAFKVNSKNSNSITFNVYTDKAPSGACVGTVKIFKSVITLNIPLGLTFDLRMKDVAVIPNGTFFVSDNSNLTNDGGLFFGDSSITLYFSRGAQFYADFSFMGRLYLRFDYGANGHFDNAQIGNIFSAGDALIVASEHSQISAWGCNIVGGYVGVYAYSGSFISLYGSNIAHNVTGVRCVVGSSIDAYVVTYIDNVTDTSPLLDTTGNGNSYINSLIDIFSLD